MRSVSAGGIWNYQGLKIHGVSLSGVRTCFAFPELHIAVDVAQGFPFAIPMRKYFITHAHLDHSAGIPYIISQKALHRVYGGDFYMPETMVEPMKSIMKIWQEMEAHEYSFSFKGIQPMATMNINEFYKMKAFEAHHRIPSVGYTLFQTKKKLNPLYSNFTSEEIRKMKTHSTVDPNVNRSDDRSDDSIIDPNFKNRNSNERGGAEPGPIEFIEESPLWSYSGDSNIEFLDSAPWIRKSKVLFIESTYIDETKSVEEARKRGHIHLDEVIERLSILECDKIVLCHISSRYTIEQIRKVIKNRFSPKDLERIDFFPFQ